MKKAAFVPMAFVIVIGLLSFVLVHRAALATSATLHFGPFASTSPDSGTCGNNWATDGFVVPTPRYLNVNVTSSRN